MGFKKSKNRGCIPVVEYLPWVSLPALQNRLRERETETERDRERDTHTERDRKREREIKGKVRLLEWLKCRLPA
jgi:hypothetical protein